MKKPDFQKHRQYKKGYKMLLRFVVYALIIGCLVYVIQQKNKGVEKKEIHRFQIEDTSDLNPH
ncbi:MAG: hypothetical protein ACPGU5_01710 [Lishizhenia sp.]